MIYLKLDCGTWLLVPTTFWHLRSWCVSCPLVVVCVIVHLHFNLVSSVLVPFQIGQLKWCEMMIELEPSFWNRTGRRNDKSARGHEMALGLTYLPLNSAKLNCLSEVTLSFKSMHFIFKVNLDPADFCPRHLTL